MKLSIISREGHISLSNQSTEGLKFTCSAEQRCGTTEFREARIPFSLILCDTNLPCLFLHARIMGWSSAQQSTDLFPVLSRLMEHMSFGLITKPCGTLLFIKQINRLLLLTSNRYTRLKYICICQENSVSAIRTYDPIPCLWPIFSGNNKQNKSNTPPI